MANSPAAGDHDDLELFREYVSTGRRAIRNQLVERHLGLAIHIARRYGGRTMSDDDLRQVAVLGLIKSVDRFDPEFGAAFSAFAGQTIEGELKRHFRDSGWMVRVPRSAQDLHLAVRRATDELTQRRGRSPNVDELADHMGIERDDVLRGIAASAAFTVDSIEPTPGDADQTGSLERQGSMAADETGYRDVEDTDVVHALLLKLPERQREIVRLRFFERMSQAEIATAVGISQMHVSRLLQRSYEQMRELMSDEQPEATVEPARSGESRCRVAAMSDLGAELDVSTTPTGWELRGELDAHTAPSLATAMTDLPDGEIIVDMAGVSFVDSSGLRVLLDATNRARTNGGDLTLSGPQASIKRLIEISGLGDFMHVRD